MWLGSDPSLQRTQGCCCTETLQISYQVLWLKGVQGAVPPVSGVRGCKDIVESLRKFPYVEIIQCTGNVTLRQIRAFPALLFDDFQAETAQRGPAAFELRQPLDGSQRGSRGMFKRMLG